MLHLGHENYIQQSQACSVEKESDLLCLWPKNRTRTSGGSCWGQNFTHKERPFLAVNTVQAWTGLALEGISSQCWRNLI